MRDLSLGETGGPGFVLANARQLARTSDGRWLAITDIKQRVTGRASVVIRAGAVAPVEDADFQESMELAGNLGNSLLGDRLGSADQGSIAVDPDDVVHAAWRRSARNGKGELWYARCSLRDGDLADPASWHGPGGDGTARADWTRKDAVRRAWATSSSPPAARSALPTARGDCTSVA